MNPQALMTASEIIQKLQSELENPNISVSIKGRILQVIDFLKQDEKRQIMQALSRLFLDNPSIDYKNLRPLSQNEIDAFISELKK